MGFTDIQFWLLFLPAFLLVYCLCRKNAKLQNLVLLAGSVLFYCSYDAKYLVVLGTCLLVSFAGGLWGSYLRDKGKVKASKAVLILAVIANVAVLCAFKYFFVTRKIIGYACAVLHFSWLPELPKVLLPVGVSFYVFQSTSYLLDVYFEKVRTEKNFINYAAFVTFFPTIVSGPILKSKEYLPVFNKPREVSWRDFESGVFVLLYGAFLKLVIANRLNMLTATVFGSYGSYSGWTLLLGAVAYSFEIYTDFAGYSFMAIAVARMLGFNVKDNFSQPYFADSIIDFWKRWHISLTSWFRDYLYIPLGGNRKGVVRRYINVAIVFLVSGIWHGVTMTFVVWGALNAALQIAEMLTKTKREQAVKRLKINTERFDFRLFKILGTFAVVTVCWIFFRSVSFTAAVQYIVNMLKLNNLWVLFDGSFFKLGLDEKEFALCVVAMIIMGVVSYLREKGRRVDCIVNQGTVFKLVLFAVMFLFITIYGVYGAEYSASNFIYAGF